MGENQLLTTEGGDTMVLEASSALQCTSPSSSPTGSIGITHHVQPQYTAEYLAQLLKDKKQLAAFPNVFVHLERLVDEEIGKVRVSLFQFEFNKEGMSLPEPIGAVNTVQEKVYVPAKDFPDYNFVGRILGPRGMTAKQLEQETGCKIMVRGRGSMRDKKKEEQNRGKPNWEHLNDELHVLIQVEDTDNRAKVKLARAVDEISKLLVPAPEGEDELKRKQLMELAIINGTYRPATQGKIALQTPRLLAPMSLPSPMRSPTLGAPIILSPTRITSTMSAPMSNQHNPQMTNALMSNSLGAFMSQTPDLFNAGFFLNPQQCFDPNSLAQALPAYAAAAAALNMNSMNSPFMTGEYPALDPSQAGAILNQQRKLLGQVRDHPYQRVHTS